MAARGATSFYRSFRREGQLAAKRRAPGTCVSWNKTHKNWVGYVVVGRKLNDNGVEVDDKLYRRSTTPGPRGEVEVEDALARALVERAEDAEAAEHAADPRNYTLWMACEDWYAWVPSTAKTRQQTADTLFGLLRVWAKPRIGDLSVFDVDVEILARFFDTIAPELSSSSLAKIRTTLRRVFEYAMRRKSETHFGGPNPVADLRDLPEAGHKTRARHFLTQETVETILTLTEGNRMHALMMLGFMLGLRPGEIRALKWEHVDLRKGVLYIVRYARLTGDGDVKTASSRRAMKIPARLLEALVAHQARYGEHQHVFTRDDGKQLDRDGLRWRAGKVFRAAGLDIEDPYVMRHTFASICYHNGMPVKDISKKMGHANERVTLTVYIHLFNPDVTDTDDLDDIWSKAS